MTGKVNKAPKSSILPSAKTRKPSPKTTKRKTTPMGQEAQARWLSRDAWNKRELMDLLCGLEPDASRPLSECANQASEAIRRAVATKKLGPVSPSDVTPGDRVFDNQQLFDPNQAIEWATSSPDRFPHFPYGKENIKAQQSSDTPINPKAQASLHQIIVVLADLAGIDLTRHHTAASTIQEGFNAFPGAVELSNNCIAGHLKDARETAESLGILKK